MSSSVTDLISGLRSKESAAESQPRLKKVMTVEDVALSRPVDLENLPSPIRRSLDSLASRLFDPDLSRTLLIGFPMAGKSFLVEQLAFNFDEYLERSNLDEFYFIVMSEQDLMESATSEGLRRYIESIKATLGVQEENLCVVTESMETALYISSISPKLRLILELNIDAYVHLQQIRARGVSKTWSSWKLLDANLIVCDKEELVDLMWNTQVARINDNSNLKLTKKQVENFIQFTLNRYPSLEKQNSEGNKVIAAPPGIWATCLKFLLSTMMFSTNPDDLGKTGKPLLAKAYQRTLEDNWQLFMPFLDHSSLDHSHDVPSEVIKVLSNEVGSSGDNAFSGYGESSPIEFADVTQLFGKLERDLKGQSDPIKKVSEALVVPAMGLNDPNKPTRSFLFLGPTGVGKTQLAINLAKVVGKEDLNLIRLDMSEYQESHEASKFYGSPPGYVGHEEGGVLTNAVRENPQSVVLLDEVEKSHPKIWDALLQVLDAGRMTDGQGNVVDFSQCIIIMTSNIGANEASRGEMGFSVGSEEQRYQRRLSSSSKIMKNELKKSFRAEFLNRVDDVIVFNELPKDVIKDIVRLEIKAFSERMKDKGFTLETPDDLVISSIMEKADISEYGARDIHREVYKNVSTPVAAFLASNPRVKTVALTAVNNGIVVTKSEKRK